MRTRYKISIWLSACLLVMGSVSCDKDFLDRNPLNAVSSQVFWTSEADVQTALAGVYSRLQQNFLGYERVSSTACRTTLTWTPATATREACTT